MTIEDWVMQNCYTLDDSKKEYFLKLATMVSLLLLIDGCHSSAQVSKSAAVTTPTELIESYRSAYDSGDKAAVLALAKWEGVPNELRKFLEQWLTLRIGKHQITQIELVPYEDDPTIPKEIDGRKVETNLDPRFWLLVTSEGNEGFEGSKSTASLKCAVGKENGILRICGIQWAND